MVDYLFFSMLGILVATGLYTRRLLKKRPSKTEDEFYEERSEAAKGLVRLSAKNPDYSGAVSVIRDKAKAELQRHKPLNDYSMSLNSIIADCTGALNKGRVSKETFIELQGAFLRLSSAEKSRVG